MAVCYHPSLVLLIHIGNVLVPAPGLPKQDRKCRFCGFSQNFMGGRRTLVLMTTYRVGESYYLNFCV